MTEKRYKEVSEFDDDLIHITCPKCKYPMRVLAKDNKGIYQCYCASCGLDRFMKDTLDEDNLTFKEFNRCVERGKAIDIERLFDFIYKQHEQIQSLKKENEQLKKDLKRCREWINSDKYDYETTLAFIKSKGYSLKDVLEYKGDVE